MTLQGGPGGSRQKPGESGGAHSVRAGTRGSHLGAIGGAFRTRRHAREPPRRHRRCVPCVQ
eukprot:6443168-Pyramimonas_sp.AAC.1